MIGIYCQVSRLASLGTCISVCTYVNLCVRACMFCTPPVGAFISCTSVRSSGCCFLVEGKCHNVGLHP